MTTDARTDIWRARWSSKVKIISQNSRSREEKMMLKWSGQCDFSSESFLVSCFFISSIYAVSMLSFVAATHVLSVTCLRRVLSEILNVEQSSRRINATSNWILLQACALNVTAHPSMIPVSDSYLPSPQFGGGNVLTSSARLFVCGQNNSRNSEWIFMKLWTLSRLYSREEFVKFWKWSVAYSAFWYQ